METEDYRGESEAEPDSDHEDGEVGGSNGTWLGHPLHNFHTDLDSYETGTVRRRTKTIVTPKMAMESFRLSFLNDDQDVNFDAILGELYELESQLNSTQSELTRSLGSGGANHPPPPAGFQDGDEEGRGSSDTLHREQEELDALAAEITQGLHYKANGHHHHLQSQEQQQHHHQHPQQQHHHPHNPHHQLGHPPPLPSSSHHHPHHHHPHHTNVGSESGCDTAETDSAFSDNASLPSSESFTSMVTVSSSADTTSSSSGETCSMSSAMSGVNHTEEEQIARMKAEKIRIALEKIKETKIRKLFVRAFAKDGSSKSILVDEKMSVAQVCSQLADKNHIKLNHRLAVVEHMPELLMERILEDHDSLVESMVMWTRDSKNKIMFEERMDKYDLFRNPEKYLSSQPSAKAESLSPVQKDRLIQEFFAPESVCVPVMEGALYLKSDGKKTWKKFFFVLKANGLFYNPKGKASKNPKDLECLVQFEFVEVYRGLGWKKKYHAPFDFCFALKHPQIQKKTSKYIRYFCAESDAALDQWVMGIRTIKLGKQMLHNYERLTHEISMWDTRQNGGEAIAPDETVCHMLNHADLSDSRMSVPEPGSRHSVIQVHNPALVRSSSNMSGDSGRDVMSIEVLAIPPRTASDSGVGIGADGKSLNGSVSSSVSSNTSESGHKTPVKRVSFSATHSIINGDSGEQTIKHRDSIISASTDSSEDSNSSGENRLGASFRGKMRPKLPLTTETTRQLADMCNVSVDETPEAIYAETPHHASSRIGSSASFSRSERRRASMTERRGSGSSEPAHKLIQSRNTPLSPQMKQHSVDSGYQHHRQTSPGPQEGSRGSQYHHHVRRKSEPSVSAIISPDDDHLAHNTSYDASGLYSTVDAVQSSSVNRAWSDVSSRSDPVEPVYNQIRSPSIKAKQPQPSEEGTCSAILPPPQFREALDEDFNHPPPLPPPAQQHEPSTPPPAPPQSLSQVKAMQVPPPPPPVSAQSKSQYHNNKKSNASPASQPPPPPTSAKSAPPPTLPKPQSSTVQSMSAQPPLPVPASQPAAPPPPPPPPAPPAAPQPPTLPSGPFHLAGSELNRSPATSAVDSPSGSPLHIAMPPPMAPITPKLPPPTLPKTTAPFNIKSSLPNAGGASAATTPKGPSSPLIKCQNQKQNGVHSSPQNKSHVSAMSTPPPPPPLFPAGGSQKSAASEEQAACHQSPSLPFLSDLSKKTQSSETEHKGADLRNPDSPSVSLVSSTSSSSSSSSSSVNQHRRSASAGSSVSKGDRKAPPPPPKRSENTRLSSNMSKGAGGTQDPVQNGASGGGPDPIYENFDGMMDIDDLPPPPPELLAGLAEGETDQQSTKNSGSGKKPKPPPPPPKRSKETQLSSH